jgi:hypothetical protein
LRLERVGSHFVVCYAVAGSCGGKVEAEWVRKQKLLSFMDKQLLTVNHFAQLVRQTR